MKTYHITLVALFAALMAIGANITTIAPFLQVGGVPLSMQPFFCILAGLLLGRRLGALSMIVYALIGIAGAPVFAQFEGGIQAIFGQTGGFILSFIFAAYISGLIVEKAKQIKLSVFLLASFVSIVLIYIIGTTYMFFALNLWLGANVSYLAAWGIMTWFMIKDIVFTVACALLASRIYHAMPKNLPIQKKKSA